MRKMEGALWSNLKLQSRRGSPIAPLDGVMDAAGSDEAGGTVERRRLFVDSPADSSRRTRSNAVSPRRNENGGIFNAPSENNWKLSPAAREFIPSSAIAAYQHSPAPSELGSPPFRYGFGSPFVPGSGVSCFSYESGHVESASTHSVWSDGRARFYGNSPGSSACGGLFYQSTPNSYVGRPSP